MRCVVFGATGFIGSHVVAQLAHSQHPVTAIVRPGADTAFLASLNVRIEPLSAFDTGTLARAIEDNDTVYNCIADVRPNRSLDEYRVVNVKLARTIAVAAARAGVRRLLQLSSVVAMGSRLPARAVNEDEPCTPRYPFERAMAEREQTVREVQESVSMSCINVRPAGTIGARDKYFHWLYQAHRAGKFPIIGSGTRRASRIDTRDIGRAMVWLGERMRLEYDTFLVRGFESTDLELKAELDALSGKPAAIQRMPAPVAKLAAPFLEWFTPAGREPMFTRHTVALHTGNALFDDTRLRAGGFRTLYGLRDAVLDAVAHPYRPR